MIFEGVAESVTDSLTVIDNDTLDAVDVTFVASAVAGITSIANERIPTSTDERYFLILDIYFLALVSATVVLAVGVLPQIQNC